MFKMMNVVLHDGLCIKTMHVVFIMLFYTQSAGLPLFVAGGCDLLLFSTDFRLFSGCFPTDFVAF